MINHIMLLLFVIFPWLVNSFTIDFPFNNNFMVKVKNIDVKKINQNTIDELRYLFKTTPVLVFENQKISPEEQFDFCSKFDPEHTNEILHPFYETAIPGKQQIALRGKGVADMFGLKEVPIRNSQVFKYTPVWHQDLVGTKDVLPPIVSSMYMIKTPSRGGYTSFASMEGAYESMIVEHRKMCNEINCVYSLIHGLGAQIDYTGYGRIDKYWRNEITPDIEKHMVTQPLVIYPTPEDTKRALMFTPNKLYKFEGANSGVSPAYTQEKIRYIMKNYVLTPGNVGKLHYKENDLVIFNNRKVIHTSSPTQEYLDERYFTLLFLGTKTPFLNSSMSF